MNSNKQGNAVLQCLQNAEFGNITKLIKVMFRKWAWLFMIFVMKLIIRRSEIKSGALKIALDCRMTLTDSHHGLKGRSELWQLQFNDNKLFKVL